MDDLFVIFFPYFISFNSDVIKLIIFQEILYNL